MRYRLIAIDLDGTLLNDGRNIPEENIKAVGYAAAKGVTVVIATGRVTTSGRVFASMLGLETYIISSNGARVYDMKNKNIIYEDGLDVKDARETADYFESCGTYYHAYIDDVMYARYMRDHLKFYIEQNKGKPPELRMDIRLCDDYDAVFRENSGRISKVMAISDDPELMRKMREHLGKNKNIVLMSSNYNNIEVMNHTVSKGNALMHLSSVLGIGREEIMAIGDNDNDISMIKWSGMGIAMGNAIVDVKNAADDITGSCGDAGVAKAIYKYI